MKNWTEYQTVKGLITQEYLKQRELGGSPRLCLTNAALRISATYRDMIARYPNPPPKEWWLANDFCLKVAQWLLK